MPKNGMTESHPKIQHDRKSFPKNGTTFHVKNRPCPVVMPIFGTPYFQARRTAIRNVHGKVMPKSCMTSKSRYFFFFLMTVTPKFAMPPDRFIHSAPAPGETKRQPRGGGRGGLFDVPYYFAGAIRAARAHRQSQWRGAYTIKACARHLSARVSKTLPPPSFSLPRRRCKCMTRCTDAPRRRRDLGGDARAEARAVPCRAAV